MRASSFRFRPLLAALAALFSCNITLAIEPESVGRETLATPTPTWVVVHGATGPGYIFDADDGEMQGMLSLSGYTPAIATNLQRGEIYAAESFYSRASRGDRADVLTIYDVENLNPVAEVEIPQKIAALPFAHYIALLDDDRHVAIYNLTPAASVSIVDVVDREFVTELSTPGCALMLAVSERGFLQICGDGTLQLIRLNRNGDEAQRIRSDKFFEITEDPVFDKAIATPAGWLLMSYAGEVFEVSVDGDNISISEGWSMANAEEQAAGWVPGGGQFLAYHNDTDLLFVLANPGGEFAHDNPGTEVWIFQRSSQRRIGRLPIEHMGTNILVSQGSPALLSITGVDSQLHVYDVGTLKLVRSIAEIGPAPGLLQPLQ